MSGLRYRTCVTEHMLKPLGMLRSFWEARENSPELLATGHQQEGATFRPVAGHHRMGPTDAAAGPYLSVEDLGRYAAFQLAAWPPSDGAEKRGPLWRSSVRESHLPSGLGFGGRVFDGMGWGLVQGEGLGHLVTHAGSTAVGCSADLELLPRRGMGVVVLTGCNKVDRVQPLASDVLEILVAEIPEPGPTLPPAARRVLERLLVLAE